MLANLPTVPAAIVIQSPNPDLVAIVTSLSIPLAKANDLIAAFSPLYDEAGKLCGDAAGVVVADATQLIEMAQARAIRLAMVRVRGSAGRAHSQIKADILTTGRAIDRAKNELVARLEPIEAQLEASEKFAERAQAARREALRAERAPQLVPYGVDPILYSLGEMPEAQWAQLLDGSRLAHEARIAAVAKAEADRLAAEQAAKAECERLTAANARLLAEAHTAKLEAARAGRQREAARALEHEEANRQRREHEAKAQTEREAAEKERQKAQAEIRKANEAREHAEAEARRVREAAEAKERADREAVARKAKANATAERKAAAQPDAGKLIALAIALEAVALPLMATGEGQAAIEQAREYIQHATLAIRGLARNLANL